MNQELACQHETVEIMIPDMKFKTSLIGTFEVMYKYKFGYKFQINEIELRRREE